MQTRNKLFDDFSQLMTNAMGVAQGAREEAETAMKGWMDRWVADRNLVTRDEFEAVALMARKAREENAALLARIVALEAAAGLSSAVEEPDAEVIGSAEADEAAAADTPDTKG